MDKKELDKRRIFFSALFPAIGVAILWLIKALELNLGWDLVKFGILPRTLEGLKGIIFGPFIHLDLTHLTNNSIPIFLLGFALFYFYRTLAWRVLFFSFLLTSLYTWISARYSYHIGASGFVYSLFAFLLFSGFIRRHIQLIAISFLVAFLYGSLIWGILPWDAKVSWEGHFWGFFVGVILSFYYRKQGPQRKVYHWEEEEEQEAIPFTEYEEVPEDIDYWKSNSSEHIGEYRYRIKNKDD